MSIAHTWGSTPAERARSYPCDRYVLGATDAYYRALTVRAPAARLFRWLCQLRVAPYSYDWIDNGGRRSPRALTPGVEALEVGQSFMRIFRLVEFERGRHVTLRLPQGSRAARRFGDLAVTYLALEQGPAQCRLLVKLVVHHPPGITGSIARWLLPWGDLVMMRRQLLTLRALAEHGAGRAV